MALIELVKNLLGKGTNTIKPELLYDSNKKYFNMIVEGTYHDEWRNSYYKVVNEEIPKNVFVVKDGQYEYKIFGLISEGSTFVPSISQSGISYEVASFSECPGFTCESNPTKLLECPRTLFLRDGRIFVRDELDKDFKKNMISSISKISDAFNNDEINEYMFTYLKLEKLLDN